MKSLPYTCTYSRYTYCSAQVRDLARAARGTGSCLWNALWHLLTLEVVTKWEAAALAMMWCKKCKAEFGGSACPAQHPRFMYSALRSSQPEPEPEREPEPASDRPSAPSGNPLKGLVEPLRTATAADKLVKGGDLGQTSAAVSSYQKALRLMVEVTSSDAYDPKVREKIEKKAAVVRKRLAELTPAASPGPVAVEQLDAPPIPRPQTTAAPVAIQTLSPVVESVPEPVTAPKAPLAFEASARASAQPLPVTLAPLVKTAAPAPAHATADETSSSQQQQQQHPGDENNQVVHVLRERLAVAEHDAQTARMQLSGVAQTASLAEQEARIQLAAARAEASETRQQAAAAAEKLRADLVLQRQRAEKAESTVEEIRAGVSLPKMAQRAIAETSRQAQERLRTVEDVAREQGVKRATEVTNLAAAVAEFAQVAEDAEARAKAAEQRMSAAVDRAEETISQQLESRQALEAKCDAAQQENKNLRGLLNALRGTVVQEQTAARVAESAAAAATAEAASEKQASISRDAQWRTELAKIDAARRAAESTVKVMSSTRMMMPGQINWPQRIMDAVAEKEQRIVELEMQLDEAWGTIQDMVGRDKVASDAVGDETARVFAALSSGKTGETEADQAAQVQLRTLATALRRMQRELGQERAAREKAEAELRKSL
eukprot:COSAG02_NODE_919_length_15936_cov_5.055314_14_plen_661_part_00